VPLQSRVQFDDPLLSLLPLDAQRDDIGDRNQGLQRVIREPVTREQGHDAREPPIYDERLAREGGHPLPPGPLPVAHAGIIRDVVGEMGLPLLGDQADLEGTDRNPAMVAIQVGV
jgi:hypothetical protein